GLRILLYVDRASLDRRFTATTTLTLVPGEPNDAGVGVEIAGGTTVEVIEESRAGTRVALDDGRVSVEGCASIGAVGPVFVPDVFTDTDNGSRTTRDDVPVLSSPTGEVLATLPRGTNVELASGRAVDGFVLIEYSSEIVRIRGVVRVSALRTKQSRSYSTRC